MTLHWSNSLRLTSNNEVKSNCVVHLKGRRREERKDKDYIKYMEVSMFSAILLNASWCSSRLGLSPDVVDIIASLPSCISLEWNLPRAQTICQIISTVKNLNNKMRIIHRHLLGLYHKRTVLCHTLWKDLQYTGAGIDTLRVARAYTWHSVYDMAWSMFGPSLLPSSMTE